MVKEHADFVEQHNIHFTMLSAKIKFNLPLSNPFPDDEIQKIRSVLNNFFELASLDKEGWDENFIYKTHVIAQLSQFMLTFEFSKDIDFNFSRNEIVESKVFSL